MICCRDLIENNYEARLQLPQGIRTSPLYIQTRATKKYEQKQNADDTLILQTKDREQKSSLTIIAPFYTNLKKTLKAPPGENTAIKWTPNVETSLTKLKRQLAETPRTTESLPLRNFIIFTDSN